MRKQKGEEEAKKKKKEEQIRSSKSIFLA